MMHKIIFSRFPAVFLLIFFSACQAQPQQIQSSNSLRLGAERMEYYLPILQGKKVGLVVNHTSSIKQTHLLDTLLSRGVEVVKIFSPEHGFRGTADAGEKVDDSKDAKTGLPIISLYGNNRKPTADQLSGIDVMIFDIQDVGVRFYTYISTLHYVMEACAAQNISVMVFDRPNPNGSYVDGPIMQAEHYSFVGMHPIPIVHGLTVAELANMINEEGWLKDKLKCKLQLVLMENWQHADRYDLPVWPSPNLNSNHAVALYPSICLFEGTVISVGRGTQIPFQVIGHPDLKNMPFSFTPVSIEGMSKNPPHENKVCYGIDLSKQPTSYAFQLRYLLDIYKQFENKDAFFNNYFEKLAGSSDLRKQIKEGWDEARIRASWHAELDQYKSLRNKYLLYP
ncbi:MAG TPA: DUF1343 domain-containing protein [Cyclobacteriaceae bacterium]|nr:DUF1343 domain-containing protein [Cyclobacteriaceae bacterium]